MARVWNLIGRRLVFTVLLIGVVFLSLTGSLQAEADDITELRQSIEAKNEEIQRLEEEAKKYREEIAKKQEAGRTLKEELARIEGTIKQLQREIKLNERRVAAKTLEIRAAAGEISEKEASIRRLKEGLENLIRALSETDLQSPLETLMQYRVISDFFRQIDYAQSVEVKILESVDTLRDLRQELEVKKTEAERRKKELENLQANLKGRKKTEDGVRQERSDLLRQTKNQEKRYQELLAEQERKRAALEDEIREIEDKLRVTIDPSTLPRKGSGVLGWPLENLVLESCWKNGNRNSWKEDPRNCITQNFGYTSFAAVGGYGGKGHNGMDFRAAPGSAVFTTADGVVEAVGDTDQACRKASYGKWILIRHPNNLSSLYAHLADIGVRQGQEVRRGDSIGLSGASGYATGPHLHFTVFATPAVRIESIRSRVCGRGMTLPISARNGYLDPLDYL